MAEVASVHPIGADLRCGTCGERFPPDYAVCPRDATPLGIASEALDPLVGHILAGSYRVIKVLAQGGMGRLYDAEHTRLPRRLAVKVIHDVYASHRDAALRFEREARAAALIDSPHVVSVVDLLRTEDDRPAIVYERLEGEDLGQRIAREGALPVDDAILIALHIARGLVAAHAAGIVHRDLKPSNVFLDACPGAGITAKLLDFGVAKLLGAPEITRTGAVVGTPAYMAPEQARGEEDIDGRADIYGLGAVLYKMVSGHAPFAAKDATASLTALLAGPPRPIAGRRPDLPVEVIRLIEDAMARDVKDRPADAREVEARLRAIAESRRGVCDVSAPEGLGRTPASAEATAVMPGGVVEAAVTRRQALARARPRALLDVAVVASAIASVAVIVLVALAQPSPLVIGALFMASLLASLGLLGRHTKRIWSRPSALSGRHQALSAGGRLGLLVLAAVAFPAAALATLTGDGPTPAPAVFAGAVGLAAVFGLVRALRESRRQDSRRTRRVPSSR